MKDKRILYVSSEVIPYLPETTLSSTAFNIAKYAHSKGIQTRIFMPRFGVINERRHQLHEVIRLSGMNLIINDMDMPLIIKVASIPKERMQVYFIDNEEYFKRKAVYNDDKKVLFPDNDERMIFFAKGVVETVKKLNWVTSLYGNDFEGELNKKMIDKVSFDKIDKEKASLIKTPNHNNILKSAIQNSDAVIKVEESYPEEIENFISESGVKVLEYQPEDLLTESYLEFYKEEILDLQDA